jgi:hypothetical protein
MSCENSVDVPVCGLTLTLDTSNLPSGGGGGSYEVGMEFDTGMTAPDGKKIYRKTYQLPTVTLSNANNDITLEDGFGSNKQLVGVDTRCSYFNLSIGQVNTVPYADTVSVFVIWIASNNNFRFRHRTTVVGTASGYVTVMYTYQYP